MTSDPRDKFWEALRYGRMNPEEAESKLKELGLPPLAPQPDPADFNPMNEVWWSLPMTVAWIAWRNSPDVREEWNSYRSKSSVWIFERWRVGFKGARHEGFMLKNLEPAVLSGLVLTEIYRHRHGLLREGALTIKDAKASLWKALGEGVIQATGTLNPLLGREIIPGHAWRDLVDVESAGRDVVRRNKIGPGAMIGYEDLAFKRQAVMALWPPSRPDASGLSLPPTVSPFEPGHMALYCAAQWIATKGGTVIFETTKGLMWEHAFSELLGRVSSGDVSVTGMQEGIRQRIDGHLFASIRIDYPFTDASLDMILSDDLYLSSYPYLDDEHWRGGLDDSLKDRRGTSWSQLMVLKSEVARWWPFPSGQNSETHSGGAGRPSMMHFIEAEYDARRARGQASGQISQISDDLHAWAKVTHPGLRAPTAATIANALRAKHRIPTK